MPRGPREDAEGAWHHVMNRGARRAPVFAPVDHPGLFLYWVGDMAERFSVEVHAFAVMTNHYHLLLRSVRGNLSGAMRHLGGGFTQEINRLRRWDGPIFRGRFRNQLLRSEAQVLTVATYLHLNPVRARMIRRLDQSCWTSHRAYLGLDIPPEWLHRDTLLSYVGGVAAFGDHVYDVRRGRQEWPDDFDADDGWFREPDGERRPWALRRLKVTDRELADKAPSPAAVLAKVTRLTGIPRAHLDKGAAGRPGNPARRLAVWALVRETDLTQAEVGALLGMSAQQVAVTFARLRRNPGEPISGWIESWAKVEEC